MLANGGSALVGLPTVDQTHEHALDEERQVGLILGVACFEQNGDHGHPADGRKRLQAGEQASQRSCQIVGGARERPSQKRGAREIRCQQGRVDEPSSRACKQLVDHLARDGTRLVLVHPSPHRTRQEDPYEQGRARHSSAGDRSLRKGHGRGAP